MVVALLLPLAKIGWDAFTDGLGANPIEAVQNRLGFWALTILALSLLPTPAKDLLGVGWLQRIRRVLGVTAFAALAGRRPFEGAEGRALLAQQSGSDAPAPNSSETCFA